MLKKKTPPVSLKYSLTVPKSLSDRIDRVRDVAEASGYELDVDETLIRSITIGVTRWEKKLGIGSNAAAQKAGGRDSLGLEGADGPTE